MQLIHCVTILYIFGISTILLGWKRFLLPKPKCMLISLNVFECELYKTIQVHRIKCCMNICEKGGIWLVGAYCRNSSSLSALFHWSQKHKSKTIPDLTWPYFPFKVASCTSRQHSFSLCQTQFTGLYQLPKNESQGLSFNTLEQIQRASKMHKFRGAEQKF